MNEELQQVNVYYRVPRIRARIFWGGSLALDEKIHSSGCSICGKKCVDKNKLLERPDRLTRSVTKWMKEIVKHKIIIYETYRCMPLLGDEKIYAPDWEEHIVRYHIVFV